MGILMAVLSLFLTVLGSESERTRSKGVGEVSLTELTSARDAISAVRQADVAVIGIFPNDEHASFQAFERVGKTHGQSALKFLYALDGKGGDDIRKRYAAHEKVAIIVMRSFDKDG